MPTVTLEILNTRLQRIEKSLRALLLSLKQDPKAIWVKVAFIQEVTGWNAERLRQARQQGIIKFKKISEGMFYDVNSLHPFFKKNIDITIDQ
jgi:hypothetical protein